MSPLLVLRRCSSNFFKRSQNYRHYCSPSSSTSPSNAGANKIVFSGIQPTGELHLGNYFGAIEHWIRLQSDPTVSRMYISVVDLHAITVPTDFTADTLRHRIHSAAASLLAAGLDPDRCVLFQQSHVSEHCEMSWILGCLSTTMARLNRLAQFKDRSAKYTDGNVPLGLFVYPVLQAADILLYKTTHVPVGDDQQQHLATARHLAECFNARFERDVFPIPEYVNSGFARVKSLRDPRKKMSKSDVDARSRINLVDEPDVIVEKFKKALSDMNSRVTYDPVERQSIANVIHIHSHVSGKSPEQICTESTNLTTAQYKLVVADCVVEKFRQFRDDYKRYMDDRSYVDRVLKRGAEQARSVASETMREVRKLVGFD